MVITKRKDLTKQGSVKYSENKTQSSGEYLIISDWSLSGRGWGGRFFEARRLLNFCL